MHKIRLKKEKNPTPTEGITFIKSVKTIIVCPDNIGYDGKEKIKGRKWHIIILAIVVHSAITHDSKSAEHVFKELKNKYLSGMIKIFADVEYRGELIEIARLKFGWILKIIKRNETGKFKISHKRWIVERTFAWISFQQRTSEDYQRITLNQLLHSSNFQ